MKKINTMMIVGLLYVATVITGCKDDDHSHPDDKHDHSNKTEDVKLNFKHVWGMNMEDFHLNTDMIHPRTSDTLNFKMFKYYISNIAFQSEDDKWTTIPETYYLVDLTDVSSQTITVKDVPRGHYKAIRFTHGVDSTRNVSGDQTGALSPSMGMYWGQDSGYIMVKAEGTSPQSPTGDFKFHLGGYTGPNNVITIRQFGFNGEIMQLLGGKQKTINFSVNPARLWHSTGSLSENPAIIDAPNPTSTTMAKNVFSGTLFSSISE
jgi:hypothetical protein